MTPDDGYERTSLVALSASDGKKLTLAADDSFTMPDSDVVVMAVFTELAAVPEATYSISFTATENGSVEASPEGVHHAGDTVQLAVGADEGYVIDSLTVRDASGNDVPVSENREFNMPASDVTVSATFRHAIAPPWIRAASRHASRSSGVSIGRPASWTAARRNRDSPSFAATSRAFRTDRVRVAPPCAK